MELSCLFFNVYLAIFLLFAFSVRVVAHRIVNFRHFDNGILVCILISSVLLACENVVNEKAKINTVRTGIVVS